jgi:hypothetical protein
MELQNNQRWQRYVNDKGIEREMGVLRGFFGGAETHPKQKANKEQNDVVHCIFSERLPVAEGAKQRLSRQCRIQKVCAVDDQKQRE